MSIAQNDYDTKSGLTNSMSVKVCLYRKIIGGNQKLYKEKN